MVHKFCENHLGELYEAIKAGRIGEIEKIEHELSPSEECVACAYALKAHGLAKEVLFEYLRSEGLAIEGSGKKGTRVLATFGFWALRLLVPFGGFLGSLLVLGNFMSLPLAFIIASRKPTLSA